MSALRLGSGAEGIRRLIGKGEEMLAEQIRIGRRDGLKTQGHEGAIRVVGVLTVPQELHGTHVHPHARVEIRSVEAERRESAASQYLARIIRDEGHHGGVVVEPYLQGSESERIILQDDVHGEVLAAQDFHIPRPNDGQVLRLRHLRVCAYARIKRSADERQNSDRQK